MGHRWAVLLHDKPSSCVPRPWDSGMILTGRMPSVDTSGVWAL